MPRTTAICRYHGKRFSKSAVGLASLSLALSGVVSPSLANSRDSAAVRIATYGDLSNNEGGAAAAVSSDGGLIAVATAEALIIRRSQDWGLLADLGPGDDLSWSPRGDRLAFVSSKSGTAQIWIWERGTGQVYQSTKLPGGLNPGYKLRVAAAGRGTALSWSPDGTQIAFTTLVGISQAASLSEAAGIGIRLTENSPVTALSRVSKSQYEEIWGEVLNTSTSPWQSYVARSTDLARNTIFILDVKSGQVREAARANCSQFHPQWSPRSTKIVFICSDSLDVYARNTGQTETVMILDAVSGQLQTAVASNSTKSDPRWSTDGSAIAFIESEDGVSWPRLRLIKTVSGRDSSASTLDLHRVILSYDWDRDGSYLAIVKDGVYTKLLRAYPTTGKTYELAERAESASSDIHGNLIWSQYDPQLGPTIFRKSGRAVQKFVVSHPSFLTTDVQVISWTNKSGELLQGTLILPPKFDPAEAYPLVIDAYPMQGGSRWRSVFGGNYALAAMGYIVFRPSPRAPSTWMNAWTDQAWSRSALGSHGWAKTLDDVMSGIDHIATLFRLRPNKVCLIGHSNGGAAATELITRSSKFSCAVIAAPVSTNLFRAVTQKSDLERPRIANDPRGVQSLSEYFEASPASRLDRISTPVLLAVGEEDVEPLQNSIEIYNVLRRNGIPITFVRYPHQGHIFTGAAAEDFWNEEVAFLKKHLNDDR